MEYARLLLLNFCSYFFFLLLIASCFYSKHRDSTDELDRFIVPPALLCRFGSLACVRSDNGLTSVAAPASCRPSTVAYRAYMMMGYLFNFLRDDVSSH